MTVNLEFNSWCNKVYSHNLDVLQDNRTDDHWNVDANRSLSDSWSRFTKFTLLKEKLPKGKKMWSRRRLTKIQATTRPESVAWSVDQNWKASQKRDKQEWAMEKPKLDNSRRWRIQRNHQKTNGENWKFRRRRLCLARKGQNLQPSGNWSEELWIQQDSKDKACMYRGGSWVHETTFGIISAENHEDHTAGKGFTTRTHYGLVHKFIPMPQAMKILDAKAAVDKESKKLEAIQNGSWKSQKWKGGYSGSAKRQEESPLWYIDGHWLFWRMWN